MHPKVRAQLIDAGAQAIWRYLEATRPTDPERVNTTAEQLAAAVIDGIGGTLDTPPPEVMAYYVRAYAKHENPSVRKAAARLLGSLLGHMKAIGQN